MSHQPESRKLPNSVPHASGRVIYGYASKFGVRSRPMVANGSEFQEIIMPGAFPDLAKQDVRATFNHSKDIILARSKFGRGTLKLSIDSIGLRYEFEAPNSTTGNDLLESIRRGDIDGASFVFRIAPGGADFSVEGGKRIRRVRKIQDLLDISVVTEGAYSEATAAARSAPPNIDPLDEIKDWSARLGLK